MGQCSCNPEIETSLLCLKYDRYVCEECLSCQDPELYCKFRSSCPWKKEGEKKCWPRIGLQLKGGRPEKRSKLSNNKTVSLLEGIYPC